jgi:hypothetical protein
MMPLYRVVLSDTTPGSPLADRTGWSRDIAAENQFDAVRLAHAAYQQEFGHACTCCTGRVTEVPFAKATPLPTPTPTPPSPPASQGTRAAAG